MPEPFHIRLALATDILAIGIIAQAAYTPYIERMGCKPAPMTDDYAKLIKAGCVWVISRADAIAGFIVLQKKPDHILINNIAIAPAHQENGCGKTLLKHAEAYARQCSMDELRLYTNEKMHENLELYSKLGWLEYNRAEQDGFHRVFFRKKIS